MSCIAGDAPDLPGLLVGKLFGACEDRAAGVLPASDGRLVAVDDYANWPPRVRQLPRKSLGEIGLVHAVAVATGCGIAAEQASLRAAATKASATKPPNCLPTFSVRARRKPQELSGRVMR